MSSAAEKVSRPDPIWYINRSILFKGLSEKEKAELADKGKLIPVARGEQVYGEGDPGQNVYLVKEGAVKIVSSTAEGKEVAIAYLGEMELFGETALVDGGPREQRAVATEECCLLALPVSTIESLMERSPALGLSITKFVGMRLRKIQMRLQNLMFRTPRQRVATLLVELAEDFGVEREGGNEIEIKLRITHHEIASLVGVTRESVTYAMGELELSEFIRVEKRRMFVLNKEGLAEL